MYYVRPDLVATVNNLLAELTLKEQQVATALASEVIAEIKFTQALQEIFDIKG
jgi:sulfur carrier protein ThiS